MRFEDARVAAERVFLRRCVVGDAVSEGGGGFLGLATVPQCRKAFISYWFVRYFGWARLSGNVRIFCVCSHPANASSKLSCIEQIVLAR